jgi:hypothetical protein
MGTIASPWRYDAAMRHALQSAKAATALAKIFHRLVAGLRLSFIADELLAHRHVRYACIIEHHSLFYVPKSFVKFARYELRAENDFVGASVGGSGRGELHQLSPDPFFP